jgi:arsenate reductase-like glutaredoxin family protein
MKENPPPREEALRLMSEHPNLIKRPILVKEGQIVLGFDEPDQLDRFLLGNIGNKRLSSKKPDQVDRR